MKYNHDLEDRDNWIAKRDKILYLGGDHVKYYYPLKQFLL